jgi:hypothetical protein
LIAFECKIHHSKAKHFLLGVGTLNVGTLNFFNLESRVDQIPFSASETEGHTWHEPQLLAWCDQALIGYIFLYLLMPTRLATRLSGIFR